MPADNLPPTRFERLERPPDRSSRSIMGLLASLAAILGILVGVVLFREVRQLEADEPPRMDMSQAPVPMAPAASPPSAPPRDEPPRERPAPPPPPSQQPAPPAVAAPPPAASPATQQRAPRVGRSSWLQGHRGFETAMSEREATDWPVIVYVSTTWCPYCRELDENLWRDGRVDRYVADTFIRVHLDPDTSPTDEALVQALGVSGFPSILVLTADTTEFRRVSGQQAGGGARPANDFIAALRRFE